jgi:hypothetical protein
VAYERPKKARKALEKEHEALTSENPDS